MSAVVDRLVGTRAARAAGLRYADTTQPGIRRIRRGRGFSYRHASGRQVRDDATLARIRSLVIPPAWNDVWICPSSRGHIQAMGRDARGRLQYRYHPAWTKKRDRPSSSEASPSPALSHACAGASHGT